MRAAGAAGQYLGRRSELHAGAENSFINLRRPGGHAEPMAGSRREGELMQFSTKTKKHRMFINEAGMAITDKQGTPRVIMGSIDGSNPVIRTGNKTTFQQWHKNTLAITSDKREMDDVGPINEDALRIRLL